MLAGPDHLAAVTSTSVDSRGRAWIHGLVWGAGHSLGLVLIGLLFILFRETGLVSGISLGAEKLVGLALIWLGISGVFNVLRTRLKSEDASGRRRHATMLGFGILHGSAGANHLIGMIPLLAADSHWETAAYLAFYCLGCVAVMALFTQFLGRVSHWFGRNEKGLSPLLLPSSVLSLVVGAIWIVTPLG